MSKITAMQQRTMQGSAHFLALSRIELIATGYKDVRISGNVDTSEVADSRGHSGGEQENTVE
jgi:hypothetical protein